MTCRRPASSTLLLLAPLLLLGPAPAHSQVVELNPVPLTGSIQIGDNLIGTLRVTASSSIGSSTVNLEPQAVIAGYETIVQVPAGGSAIYTIQIMAGLTRPDGTFVDFRMRSPSGVRVFDGEPATLDLILDPVSQVEATVTALPGELLERVTFQTTRWDQGPQALTFTQIDAPPGGVEVLSFVTPVPPDTLLRCYGFAQMTNGRNAELEPFQLVTVPDGGVETCTFTPVEPPVTGTFRGSIAYEGPLAVDAYTIFMNRIGSGPEPPDQTLLPPFTGPGQLELFEFTDVVEGLYDVDALIVVNGDDRLAFPIANRFEIGAGVHVAVLSRCQATIESSFVFGGTTRPEDWQLTDRPVSANLLGEGNSQPLSSPLEGPVRIPVSSGRWEQTFRFGIQRESFEPGGFTSTNSSSFRFSQPIDVDCGETVVTPDRAIETGRIEVRFQVADGSFLRNPIIRSFCTHDDPDSGEEVYRYEVISFSRTTLPVPVGIVPVEAPAGVCDMQATAQVGDVTVSFGSLNDIEIVPGVEVVIGLGGPRIEILSPVPGQVVDAPEIVVEGTATDDGEVVSVVVNGVEATLVSSGNPSDPREVLFSALVPLESGPNAIVAVATDDDANETRASLGIENEREEEPPLPCDVDGDGDVDASDVGAIFAARGSPASGPDDVRDSNGDGLITINDGRLCVLQCTNPGCAP